MAPRSVTSTDPLALLLILQEERERVVNDSATPQTHRPDLDRLDPALLGDPSLRDGPIPLVLRHGVEVICFGNEDHIRLPEVGRELPVVRVGEFHWQGHISLVPER